MEIFDLNDKKKKRSKFFPEEDKLLIQLVKEHGEHSWELISSKMSGRNVRQCRERWKHYLSASSYKNEWTTEEDELLIEKMSSLGPKWTKISHFLNGRTDIQVKNRAFQLFGNPSNFPKVLKQDRSDFKFEPVVLKKDNTFDISSIFPENECSNEKCDIWLDEYWTFC